MSRTATWKLSSVICTTALAIALAAPHAAFAQKAGDPSKYETDPKMQEGGAIPPTELPKPPASGEMSFVFTDWTPAVYPGWDACPTGWSMTPSEEYLAQQTPKERKRLMLHENEPEFTAKWKASVVNAAGHNVCTNYLEFPNRPPQHLVQSKMSYGVDLEQDDTYTCPHEKFTSPLGGKIDNQVYRVLGCSRFYRGPDGNIGEGKPGIHAILAAGEFVVVMQLRGVHSLENDDNVEVLLASSDQVPIVDSQQNFIKDASFNVIPNARWRHVLHGKIVNGVLTTEPTDIHLRRAKDKGGFTSGEWDIARAKLQMAFRPDGTLQGVLGGYEPIFDIIQQEIRGGVQAATTAGSDCASKYFTMKKLADGARDPQTGQCSRISNGYTVAAVPAFVFDHPPANTKTADAK